MNKAKKLDRNGGAEPVKLLQVTQLDFDRENPRLPVSIDKEGDEDIIEYMLSDSTIIELMGSIGAQDYFSGEPLLVVPSRTAGRFVVVEGNRRLTAVKLLLDPSLASVKKNAVREAAKEAQYRPRKLPVIEFPKRDDILLYLGYRHITGVKAWDSLAKARHLEALRKWMGSKNDERTYRKLAKTIGSRSDYVKRLLASYKVYRLIEEKDFYSIKGLDETTFNFSLLTTALSYSDISDFVGLEDNRDPELVGLNKPRLKDLTKWIFEKNEENRTRIGESRNLKLLSAVVTNPTALAYFNRGEPLETAAIYTEQSTESFRKSVQQAKARLLAAQANVHLVEKPQEGDFDVLREISSIAKTLMGALKSKSDDAEEN